jgi:hypothetical protein
MHRITVAGDHPFGIADSRRGTESAGSAGGDERDDRACDLLVYPDGGEAV